MLVPLAIAGLILLFALMLILYLGWAKEADLFEFFLFNQSWMNLLAGILSIIGELISSINGSDS